MMGFKQISSVHTIVLGNKEWNKMEVIAKKDKIDVSLTAFTFNKESSFANFDRYDDTLPQSSSRVIVKNNAYHTYNKQRFISKEMVTGSVDDRLFSNTAIGFNQIGRQISVSSGILFEFPG